MNIIFFASSQFAIPSLNALVKTGHRVSCVVTQPDKAKGRHLHSEGTVVKNLARASGLNIFQPENINSPQSQQFLRELKPDLYVVIAYGQILSQEILDIPELLAINLHASYLPKYRGAAPINWALINGESATGVTVMKLVKRMDAGPILSQEKVIIQDSDTAVSLSQKLAQAGCKMLLESIEKIEEGKYKLSPQDENKASFAPKLNKQDGLIDWSSSAAKIHNLARGCFPWPSAFTYYKGRMLKIFKSDVLASAKDQRPAKPGTIKGIHKEDIVVATGKDDLIIKELQIEGKRVMSAREFLSGHRIKAGEGFDKKSVA